MFANWNKAAIQGISCDRILAAYNYMQSYNYTDAVQILDNKLTELIEERSRTETTHSNALINVCCELLFQSMYRMNMHRQCLDKIHYLKSMMILPSNNLYVELCRGWCHCSLSEFKQAADIARRLLKDNKSLHNPISTAEILYVLGRSLHGLKKCDDALRALRDANALFRFVGINWQVCATFNALGIVEKDLGSLSKAIGYYDKAINTGRGETRTHIISDILMNKSVALLKIGKYKDSEMVASRALSVDSSNALNLSRILIVLARSNMEMGLYDKARGYLSRSLASSQEGRYPREEILSLESLGDLQLCQSRIELASRYYLRALHVCRSSGEAPDLVGGLYIRLANHGCQVQDYAGAMAYAKRALAIFSQAGIRYEEGEAHAVASDAYLGLRNYDKAHAHIRQSISLFSDNDAWPKLAKAYLAAAKICCEWFGYYRYLKNRDAIAANILWINSKAVLKDARSLFDMAWSYLIEANSICLSNGILGNENMLSGLAAELKRYGSVSCVRSIADPERDRLYINDRPFIAKSPAITALMPMVDIAAETAEPVLLTGETGTGKELIARLIHERSARAGLAFVPVNCAAIPETLFEREFFGHARGAFTGADEEKPGLCEQADGGTLFLDEIGDMPTLLQVKLLRMLQEGTFHRLGDPVERRADLRIVAATNAPLSELIAARRFRQDLYYRLQTLEMQLPPLRARPEDIEPLTALFAGRALGGEADPRELFDEEVLEVLRRYPWPGNVRELEAITRRLALLARHNGLATVEMLPDEMRRWRTRRPQAAGSLDLASHVERAERERIAQALLIEGGNRSRAARVLGISRNQLYRKIERLGIEIPA